MGQNSKPNPDTEDTPGALVSTISPEFTPKLKREGESKDQAGLGVHTCCPSTQEAGGSRVQGHPWLCNELQPSLSDMARALNNLKPNKRYFLKAQSSHKDYTYLINQHRQLRDI